MAEPAKYRKIPVVIEAMRFEGTFESFRDIVNGMGIDDVTALWGEDNTMLIETLESTMVASPGDYIIKGVKGEFYPCKPDIFAMTYEQVKETD